MKGIILAALLSGPGALVVIAILARMVPNEYLYSMCEAIGKTISGRARKKVGKAFWEPIESFIQNSLGMMARGLMAGFDADDNNRNGDEK